MSWNSRSQVVHLANRWKIRHNDRHMTNEQLFDDLKHFIEATVSQHVAELRDELRGEIRQLNTRIDTLDQKLDQVQDAIGETFSQTAEDTNRTLRDHDRRLARLERRSA